MNRMLEIEQLAESLTNMTAKILESNFPLDSRRYLSPEDKAQVDKIDAKIEELEKEYKSIFLSLTEEEQRQKRSTYVNIKGQYFKKTYYPKGIIEPDLYDENSLREAFDKAYVFGKKSLEGLQKATTEQNQSEIDKNNKVLFICKGILKQHFWGEPRLQGLDRYKQRLEIGRTIDDDIRDYSNLLVEFKEVEYNYAKAQLRGITTQEIVDFHNKFDELFKKERQLLEFIPQDKIAELIPNKPNLRWLKLDAEKDPSKVVEEYETQIYESHIDSKYKKGER